MFDQLTSAIQWLETRFKFRPKSDLLRMEQAYKMLGIDLSGIKKIHIAGTNGKGSVASYVSHVLIEAGYHVGTYTSPYLVRFNERIRYDFKEILDDELLELTNIIYDFNQSYEKTYGEPLAFFELLTLMSMLYFKHKGVDVMVMEVGLGGLLDATNVLNYDVSLITSIGFDHMKQLGNTLESIAYNKLGILKPGNHLITTVDPSLHDFFISHIKETDATYTLLTKADVDVYSHDPITFSYHDVPYTLSLRGEYQILNALISIEAIHYLFPMIQDTVIQKGMKKATWPGRLDMIYPNVYIDGAHNTHAIQALKETALKTFEGRDIHVLFSALGDKDIDGMIRMLKSFAKEVVVTAFPDPRYQDLSRLCDSETLCLSDLKEAVRYVKHHIGPKTTWLITGSLHFVGYVKKHEAVLFGDQ